MNIEQRIDTTFSKLGLREPFVAAVMTRVKREFTDKVPTAATNGSSIKFNPTWCDKWTDEQLFGLTLHESLHVVLMHMWRRENRDPKIWNVANDAIINKYIRNRGYELPTGGVELPWVGEEMDSEYVYRKLKEQQEEQQQQSSGGSSDSDDSDDSDGGMGSGGFDGQGDLEDAVDEATRTDMEATIAAAARMAKDCGQGSSLIDRILEGVGDSKVDWRDVTRSMMTESSAADYTYLRPSRRFIGAGLYLPSLRTDALGGLAIGFDTSCSVSDADCAQIAVELQAIVDDLQPAFVEVVYCDSAVASVQRFERDEPLHLKPKGGGGTRFKPVFDHFAKSDERYCGMIYFTDMEGNLHECDEPDYPVIWANTGMCEYKAPFGTAVKVSI